MKTCDQLFRACKFILQSENHYMNFIHFLSDCKIVKTFRSFKILRKVILTSFSLIFSLGRGHSMSLHLTLMGRQRLCAIVMCLVAESNCVASTQKVVPMLPQHLQSPAPSTQKPNYNILENVQWSLFTFGLWMRLTTSLGVASLSIKLRVWGSFHSSSVMHLLKSL